MNIHIDKARDFLAKHRQWGQLLDSPFNTDDIRGIIEAYENELRGYELTGETVIHALKAQFDAHKAELYGRIGGLQKRVNELEAELTDCENTRVDDYLRCVDRAP